MCFLLTFRWQESTGSKEATSEATSKATTRYTRMEHDGKLELNLFNNASEYDQEMPQ